MSLAYKALCNASYFYSTWVPSIYIDIISPQSISDSIPSCVGIKNIGTANIVPLKTRPSLQLEFIISQVIKYQKGVSFCFEGFNAVNDKYQSVSHY